MSPNHTIRVKRGYGIIPRVLQITAELVERRTAGPAQELRLRAPELARRLSAGQAVLVRAGWGLEPFLRRTFHPIAVDAESWTLRVPPSGDWGHAWLRTAAPGTGIDCLGPVGRGYEVAPGARNLLCTGEGEAAWALLPAVVAASAAGLSTAFAVQAARERDLIPPGRLPPAVEYRFIRSEGSRQPGPAALGEWLGWADLVLVAGSLEFYGRLAEAIKTVRFGVSRGFAQVLYPQAFFCGTGACLSCVADLPGGRRRICRHGPVLDLADILPGH
jgi:dihydroorotate dehydrogenase electron transfer subunit